MYIYITNKKIEKKHNKTKKIKNKNKKIIILYI